MITKLIYGRPLVNWEKRLYLLQALEAKVGQEMACEESCR